MPVGELGEARPGQQKGHSRCVESDYGADNAGNVTLAAADEML